MIFPKYLLFLWYPTRAEHRSKSHSCSWECSAFMQIWPNTHATTTCLIRNVQPVLRAFWHCTFDIHCLSAIPGHTALLPNEIRALSRSDSITAESYNCLVYEEQSKCQHLIKDSGIVHEQREVEFRLKDNEPKFLCLLHRWVSPINFLYDCHFPR